jgi:hypothetical protein
LKKFVNFTVKTCVSASTFCHFHICVVDSYLRIGTMYKKNIYDVGVKRYFDPSDTELLRALHSRNSKNIRNPLIFLQKMAPYSCFWRVPSSKILLQASLHRIYDLLTLVSSYIHPTHYLLLRVQFLCFKLLPCVNRWHPPKKPAPVPKHQYRSQN